MPMSSAKIVDPHRMGLLRGRPAPASLTNSI
jgi:hypothetical protein